MLLKEYPNCLIFAIHCFLGSRPWHLYPWEASIYRANDMNTLFLASHTYVTLK